MPAKKDPQAAAAAKAHAAKKAKALEDKTFGLKNKNKSVKVQKCAPAASRPRACGLTVPSRTHPLRFLWPARLCPAATCRSWRARRLAAARRTAGRRWRTPTARSPRRCVAPHPLGAPRRPRLAPPRGCAPRPAGRNPRVASQKRKAEEEARQRELSSIFVATIKQPNLAPGAAACLSCAPQLG